MWFRDSSKPYKTILFLLFLSTILLKRWRSLHKMSGAADTHPEVEDLTGK